MPHRFLTRLRSNSVVSRLKCGLNGVRNKVNRPLVANLLHERECYLDLGNDILHLFESPDLSSIPWPHYVILVRVAGPAAVLRDMDSSNDWANVVVNGLTKGKAIFEESYT